MTAAAAAAAMTAAAVAGLMAAAAVTKTAAFRTICRGAPEAPAYAGAVPLTAAVWRR